MTEDRDGARGKKWRGEFVPDVMVRRCMSKPYFKKENTSYFKNEQRKEKGNSNQTKPKWLINILKNFPYLTSNQQNADKDKEIPLHTQQSGKIKKIDGM